MAYHSSGAVMIRVNPKEYFQKCDLMESILFKLQPHISKKELHLVFTYAAEILSAQVKDKLDGIVLPPNEPLRSDDRRLIFTDVSSLLFKGRPWDGTDQSWCTHSVTGNKMPVITITGHDLNKIEDEYETTLFVSPVHGSIFTWRFKNLYEEKRLGYEANKDKKYGGYTEISKRASFMMRVTHFQMILYFSLLFPYRIISF